MIEDAKDDHIVQPVNINLAARGIGLQSTLAALSSNCLITQAESVQDAHQKRATVKAITGIAGVRFADQLVLNAAVKHAK